MYFKVGDRVRLSEFSEWLGQEENPSSIDESGIIMTITDHDTLNICVLWRVGSKDEYWNSYGWRDLVPINEFSPLKYLDRFEFV